MPALRNKKHEAFTNLVVTGVNPTDAYVSCGYSEGGKHAATRNLLNRADIQARIIELKVKRDEMVADLVPQIVQRDAMDRAFRIKLLDKYASKIEEVFAARAADSSHQEVPGYSTGVVVVTMKQVGTGYRAIQVKEGAIDAPALRELRAHGEQIAKEAGQWVERHEDAYTSPEQWPDEVLDAKIAAARAKLAKTVGKPDSAQVQ
jgi:phage terminase small subunit